MASKASSAQPSDAANNVRRCPGVACRMSWMGPIALLGGLYGALRNCQFPILFESRNENLGEIAEPWTIRSISPEPQADRPPARLPFAETAQLGSRRPACRNTSPLRPRARESRREQGRGPCPLPDR